MAYPDTGWSDKFSSPRGSGWRFLAFMLLLAAGVAYFQTQQVGGREQSLSYTAFVQDVKSGRVRTVTFRGDRISGVLAAKGGTQPKQSTATRFRTVMPPVSDPQLLQLLRDHDVTVRARSAQHSVWLLALVNFLPWLLLIGLAFFAMRRMQQGAAGQGGLFGIGRSPAKRFQRDASRVSFDDVAGLEGAKADLQEIVGYLREPQRYRKLGAKIPRGVLLMGPPGTGKTLLARAVAGEADVAFFSIGGSEFIQMFVGVGASRVRDMFENAKREAPSIIFIDELDAVGRTRGAGVGGGHDEREQTLNQILSEMDGFAPNETVLVIAATNRPDVLDPALMRPGRFDRKVALQLPDKRARRRILEVHTRKVPLAKEVDLSKVAAQTVGFAGADLENLVNEAALLAARARRDRVDMHTLGEARDKILLGSAGEIVLTDEQKELVAYHESGHALLAWLLPHADPLEKVTIIPRGHALGATSQMPDEDRYHLKESYLRDRIEVMLGGRVSEKLVYGEVTSGAEQDLKQATQLARRMVTQWGMSEKIGAVAFRRGEQHVFLGQELAQEKDYSERTAQTIDEEVRSLIGELEHNARRRLEANRARLDALAHALREHETLTAEQMREVLEMEPAAAAPSKLRDAQRLADHQRA